MLARRFIFGAIAVAALLYLMFRPPHDGTGDPNMVNHEFPAMGTWFTLTIWAEDADRREPARAALVDVEQFLLAYADTWIPEGRGALGAFNAELAEGRAARVPEQLEPLFARAEAIRDLSGGRFDARLGELIRLWGFDLEERFRESPPPEADIDALLGQLRQAPAWAPSQPYGPAPAVQWAFGAIAKGDAVRQSVRMLDAAGFDNVIVNAGGDLHVRGKPGDRHWRIAVRHPRPAEGPRVLAAIDISDAAAGEAIFTSGDYERYFDFEGERYHHIIDPASGQPARGLRSVTVVHPDTVLADAASTALFVAGSDWRELARNMALDTVLVVRDDGHLELTPLAAERFSLIGKPDHTVVP
jgi:thiamine biosynthesis lipoprotein